MTKHNNNRIIIQGLFDNYTIMQFTTTTEIARMGSKIFQEYDEAIVLNNNKNIWLLLWWKLAQALLDSGVLQQLKEELWEINDNETVETIRKYKLWDKSWNISLSDYRKKHGL